MARETMHNTRPDRLTNTRTYTVTDGFADPKNPPKGGSGVPLPPGSGQNQPSQTSASNGSSKTSG